MKTKIERGKKGKKKGKKTEEEKEDVPTKSEEKKIADKVGFFTPALKIASPKTVTLKPAEIWKRINEIAMKRYDYKFEENYEEFQGFKYGFNKLATLR